MAIRVVNNKKVEMTEDEWERYNKIVQSYTDITGKGEDLFMDLFETNEEGIILMLNPPTKRRNSLEVFLFLMALMQQQHLRLMYQLVGDAIADLKKNNKAT